MALKNRSKVRSRGQHQHQQQHHQQQQHNNQAKRETETETEDIVRNTRRRASDHIHSEGGQDNDLELVNIWSTSFPTTVPHLLALLNLVYAAFISHWIKFEIGARETVMGLTDWLSSSSSSHGGRDEGGVERLAMIERPGEDDVDDEVPQARRGSPEGKQIRRRRHQPDGQAGESSSGRIMSGKVQE